MRVDIQQNIAQVVNIDRFQPTINNPQIAESIQYMQNIAEQREAERKSSQVTETKQNEKTEPVNEERRRKALMTRKRKDEENQDEPKETEDEKETNPGKFTGNKIDIRV